MRWGLVALAILTLPAAAGATLVETTNIEKTAIVVDDFIRILPENPIGSTRYPTELTIAVAVSLDGDRVLSNDDYAGENENQRAVAWGVNLMLEMLLCIYLPMNVIRSCFSPGRDVRK